MEQHYVATLITTAEDNSTTTSTDVTFTANSIEHALDRADFISEGYDNTVVDRVRTRVLHHHVSPSKIISEVK